MNCYVELAVAAVILYLLYNKPSIVTEYANTILGKVALLSLVIFVTKKRGLIHGAVMVIFMLTMIHGKIEGFVEGAGEVDDGGAGEGAGKAGGVADKEGDEDDENPQDVSGFDVRLQEGMMNSEAMRSSELAKMEY